MSSSVSRTSSDCDGQMSEKRRRLPPFLLPPSGKCCRQVTEREGIFNKRYRCAGRDSGNGAVQIQILSGLKKESFRRFSHKRLLIARLSDADGLFLFVAVLLRPGDKRLTSVCLWDKPSGGVFHKIRLSLARNNPAKRFIEFSLAGFQIVIILQAHPEFSTCSKITGKT